jgi:hypothetical protein
MKRPEATRTLTDGDTADATSRRKASMTSKTVQNGYRKYHIVRRWRHVAVMVKGKG